MSHRSNYLVHHTEVFESTRFPLVNEEILSINDQTKHIPEWFKADIITSFLKDHSLLSKWIKINPKLATIVISGALFTGAIESLFEACKENSRFKAQFETYLGGRFL